MTRRFNPYLAAAFAATSLALAVPATAQADMGRHHGAMAGGMHSGMHGRMHGGMHEGVHGGMRLLRGLDLTEEQRDAVFKIFHEQAPAAREQRKAMREAHAALRELATAPNFDRARAEQLANAAAKAHAELAVMRAESAAKVVALLTAEQRAKLEQRIKARR